MSRGAGQRRVRQRARRRAGLIDGDPVLCATCHGVLERNDGAWHHLTPTGGTHAAQPLIASDGRRHEAPAHGCRTRAVGSERGPDFGFVVDADDLAPVTIVTSSGNTVRGTLDWHDVEPDTVAIVNTGRRTVLHSDHVESFTLDSNRHPTPVPA